MIVLVTEICYIFTMTTKAMEKTIRILSKEVNTLRSFFIDAINSRDDEGAYKAVFVREVLKAAKQKAAFQYSGKGSLLQQIKAL